MTRIPPAALMLCIAACSPEPQRNAVEPAAEPSAAATAAAAPATSPPGEARDTATTPGPGELKTFGDWTVGCDNTLRCELRSLAPEGEGPGGATVSIARDAGPNGAIGFAASSNDEDRLSASVEGSDARTPAALVAAMANGRRMLARAGGAVLTVSLKGASAALRYVDAVQGRAGTVTALVAKGPKLAGAVPAPPTMPVIVAPASGGSAAKATAEQLAAMRRAAECDDQPDAPEFHALGGGRTLVLLPCSSGAYNVLQALFVLDGAGFAPVRADAPIGFAETGAEGPKVPATVNGAFRGGVLTSYAKGRGLGDCGVNQELVWDGTRLRLSRQRVMGECRGNIDYITTWRAQVVRR